MNAKKIIEIVNKFKDANILIVGDIMLDKYIWGEVKRISQEAPVQIAHINNETYAPGGAANVANNISALGAKVTVVGLVGNDEAKNILINELKKRDINTKGIITDPNRPTTAKIRVIAQNQQLMRMDYEKSHEPEYGICERILDFIKSTINLYDVVIISDYSKGVVTKEMLTSIKKLCSTRKKKIVVDPKPKNMALYDNVFMITPNHIEASKFTGIEEGNNNANINKMGEKIQKSLNTNVLITRGSKGVTLFEKGKDHINIPTKAKEVYDITGAGDTIVAALALAIASGSDLRTASLISNYAAGIVVGKLGTSTLTKDELIKAIKET